MDEQQVRLLVRQAIARHLGAPGAPASPAARPASVSSLPVVPAPALSSPVESPIASRQFVILRPAGETECVIEPSVTCNHCGYCLCYGH